MKEGVLVEPKAAGKISGMQDSEQAELLERVRAEKPLVIGEEFFQNAVEVSEMREPMKFSVQDATARINSYFNAMQSIFEKRNRAVSISNASGSASVIGLARNIFPDGFELEDSTGTIKVISKAQVDEDDAVMVAGKAAGETLYADYIEFPDMPEKQIKKSPKKCETTFAAKPCAGDDYCISFGEKISIEKDSLVVGKNPVQVKINNIIALVLNSEKNTTPLQVLKKRRLPGTLFAIMEVPDIFLMRGDNLIENYKGTTVVAVDDKSVARINLKTREARFEELPEQKQTATM